MLRGKGPTIPVPEAGVPSMIVTSEGSSKVELLPVPPLPEGVIDLSANVPVDSWMANPTRTSCARTG